eukprot:43673-Heterocapsa_arctica.AAC.1
MNSGPLRAFLAAVAANEVKKGKFVIPEVCTSSGPLRTILAAVAAKEVKKGKLVIPEVCMNCGPLRAFRPCGRSSL